MKIDSWCHYGEHAKLTAKESKRVLKACCVVDDNGCWIWQLNTFKSGYGRLPVKMMRAIGAGTGRAHVVVYTMWNRPIPGGLYVCHSCDVKRCINPRHLWLGTNKDNQLDASRKGVFARYWTLERRRECSARNSGAGNSMHGRNGKLAPCWGRRGSLRPMFGKHHTRESRDRISASLCAHYRGDK